MAIRKGIMSVLLSMLIVVAGASIAVPRLTLVAGALTLACAVVGLTIARKVQFVTSIVLIACGLIAAAVAAVLGEVPTAEQVLTVNQDLIAMIVAVSFIQIIAGDRDETPPRLSGAPAVWRTAGAVHVLGAIINISTINIVGDHLRGRGRLRRLDQLIMSRSFSTAAFWSPFWGASAAAIAYAPGAKTPVLVLCGLILTAGAMLYSLSALVRRFRGEVEDYRGYALSWRTLQVPLVLVVLVLTLHLLLPNVPFPRLVLVSAIVVVVVTLVRRRPRAAASQLAAFIRSSLPSRSGEVTLFAAAGVLAIGLGSLVGALDFSLPIPAFTLPVAWCTTAVMAAMSLIGVHPVISIAAIAPIVAPLHPDPTLYAMCGMIAWGASSAAGPISGLNIYMNGRFDVNNFWLARSNLVYLCVVFVLAWPVLWLCSLLG